MQDSPPSALLGHRLGRYPSTGFFVCFEGGEGAGKSTQAQLLSEWFEAEGREVVLTREPGGTAAGQQIRHIVLDPATGVLDSRAEALLYAADKADHVTRVVLPALERGAVVITDRYVDSTLAYQGAGRAIELDELESIARWATGDLRPHLTVLLDLEPGKAFTRFGERDRIEGEPLDFHTRVRQGFLDLAHADPDHYLVLDATGDIDDLAVQIRRRIQECL